MEKIYTCIVCPLSCTITVKETGDGLDISGHSCKKGLEYAGNEHRAPKRMLTGAVAVENGVLRRLPVVSRVVVPKDKLRACIDALSKVSVIAPIRCGDVVVPDICGTGVDVIAARDVEFDLRTASLR